MKSVNLVDPKIEGIRQIPASGAGISICENQDRSFGEITGLHVSKNIFCSLTEGTSRRSSCTAAESGFAVFGRKSLSCGIHSV